MGVHGEIGWCQMLPHTAATLARWHGREGFDLHSRQEALEAARLYLGHARRALVRACGHASLRALLWAYNRGLSALHCEPPLDRYVDEARLWMMLPGDKYPRITLAMRGM